MIELKPCPFCGGKANFFTRCHSEKGIIRGWEFGIYCTKCNVTTPKTTYNLEIQLDEFGNVVPLVDDRDKAIEAWNGRFYNG